MDDSAEEDTAKGIYPFSDPPLDIVYYSDIFFTESGAILIFRGIIIPARPRSSMDRVPDFESVGCAFESRRGRYI